MAVESDLAKSSLLAAALNSLVAIVLRLLTFVSNAFILRYVSREALVRMPFTSLLYCPTVLHFCSFAPFNKIKRIKLASSLLVRLTASNSIGMCFN